MHLSTGLRTLAVAAAIVAGVGCGFGLYDDSGSPQTTGSNSGVPGAGMWWPWACPNGSNPAPATTPQSYKVTGTCGAGGTLSLSVNGCEMQGNWDVLQISDVSTNISTSIPAAGGWEIAGTCGGGTPCTCDATVDSLGVITLTCSATGDGGVAECTATLTPVAS